MHKPVMLFRPDWGNEHEIPFAKKYFDVYCNRTQLPAGNRVVARYSALPFYQELEADLKHLDCSLVNTHREHKWIAEFHYYENLKYFTFPSWTRDEFRHADSAGPFVVKGRTNSRKFRWDETMFAPTRERAYQIADELDRDSLVSQQGVIFRQYVPLKTLEVGLHGLPFSNEFRFFFYKERLLSYGFYWSEMTEKADRAVLDEEGLNLAKAVAEIAAKYCTFFVVDVAEKAAGGWVLVELNDGQMSGPSANDLDTLYKNLADAVEFG